MKFSAITAKFFRPLTLGIAPLMLVAGCSTLQGGHADVDQGAGAALAGMRIEKRADKKLSPLGQSMQSGIDAIVAGDARRANHEFNLAIARDLKNPALHAANALAYQIRTRAGERDLFNLAETGYLVALEQQHDFQNAALQLAHLYLENKRYPQAQRAAAYALKLESENVEALYLLASASYSLGDVELALWSVEQARAYAPQDKRGARMVPAIYGSAGLTDEADAFLNEKRASFDQQDSNKLKHRVAQWKEVYALANSADGSNSVVHGDDTTTASTTAVANAGPGKPEVQGPLAYAWSDCAQRLGANAGGSGANGGSEDASSSGGGSIKVDETSAMPSLPSPCRGRPMPQMAIIDVVILRTNELSTSSSGINLLENLAVTVQQSSNKVSSSIDGGPSSLTSTLTRTVGLGTSAGGAIAYSLNIANVTGQTTEVISRPSLQVLDRQSAQFFSGSNISIGLPGSATGASSFNEINVGLSLSVTPTFVDESQLLLNVKAVHTFFEPITGSSTFSQALQTSRNMVAAATKIRMNETLVLSGLTEREAISGSSGVPILKDIPGVQYLFSKNTVQNFNKTVLILITPRRIMTYGDTLKKVNEMESYEKTEPKLLQGMRLRAVKDLGGRWPNLYHAIKHMARQERAFGVRANDIELEDWNRPSRIQKILQDAVNSLYFQ